jgi:hypothetical protein
MLKLLKIIPLSIISLLFVSSNAFAVSAETVKACDADTHLFTGTATACRFTPQSYKANVFEMGLCTVDPMSGASLDKTTCTTVFTATDTSNGSAHDFALGDAALVGTSSRPNNGVYKFPYIILSNVFTLTAEFERGGTTYYVRKTGSACDAVNTSGPAQECSSTLIQFNQSGDCDGEYLGAKFEGGSLNGYLMRASDLDKRDGSTDDAGDGTCSNVDRLVGVMELDTALNITPSVMNFKFTFNVTGYGGQMFTGASRPNNNPNGGGGSGPFSGFFTITEAPQQ